MSQNLAFDESYSSLKKSLKDKLIGDLKKQGDPRVLGNGDVFDQYPYSGENVKNFYSRHMGGEKSKPIGSIPQILRNKQPKFLKEF